MADGQRLRGGAEDQQGARCDRRLDDWRTCRRSMRPNCCGAASCRSTALPRRSMRPRPRRSSARRGRGPCSSRSCARYRRRQVEARRAVPRQLNCSSPSTKPKPRRCSPRPGCRFRRAGAPANADEAAAAAASLGFPVALKALGIAHKSEHGRGPAQSARRGGGPRGCGNALSGLGTGLYVERMVPAASPS